ncbi:hypothetical protein CKO44_07590 [Rubrivivax gelatinosus]|uniref:phage minor head protein n=1 Tax=Rubrivivax gelatinosus TaxID=28068 RepID=UPI0019053779|nr:hypothetical protein [Rubrivivax gelatinosus]MBZ8143116.1 phage head morphogenesis protein [Rubrivivax gelatinosus]
MPEVEARGLPFQEAIDYLKGKLPEASLAWDSLAGPVHAKVFTVAGATTADLARDLQGALAEALESGSTITAFRKAFDQTVQKHGWSYRGSRGWRTDLIFNVNMRSAHMAGRWAQIQANKKRRPFLQYRTAGDARVRPMHRRWNGLIFPVDDAFWETHYPPCGWNCRCTVRAFGQADLEDRGLKPSPPFESKVRNVVSADGEVVDQVPVGIDPGWDHNVGRSWINPELALGEKLARLPPQLRGPIVDKTISPAFQQVITERWKAFRSGVESTGKPQGMAQVVGYLDSATLDGLDDAAPGLSLESTMVGVWDKRTAHLQGSHKTGANPLQVWPAAWIDDLPDALRNYRAVLWDKVGQVLVVVPQGSFNDRVPKVVLRPNVHTRFGGSAWSVVSLGSAKAANFGEQRYVLLVGRVD